MAICPFTAPKENAGKRLNCVSSCKLFKAYDRKDPEIGECAIGIIAQQLVDVGKPVETGLEPWTCSCGKKHMGPIDVCSECGEDKKKPKKVFVLEQLKSMTRDSGIEIFEDEETAYQRFLLVLSQDMDLCQNTFGNDFSFKKAVAEREYYIEDDPEHCTWTTRLVTREVV